MTNQFNDDIMNPTNPVQTVANRRRIQKCQGQQIKLQPCIVDFHKRMR